MSCPLFDHLFWRRFEVVRQRYPAISSASAHLRLSVVSDEGEDRASAHETDWRHRKLLIHLPSLIGGNPEMSHRINVGRTRFRQYRIPIGTPFLNLERCRVRVFAAAVLHRVLHADRPRNRGEETNPEVGRILLHQLDLVVVIVVNMVVDHDVHLVRPPRVVDLGHGSHVGLHLLNVASGVTTHINLLREPGQAYDYQIGVRVEYILNVVNVIQVGGHLGVQPALANLLKALSESWMNKRLGVAVGEHYGVGVLALDLVENAVHHIPVHQPGFMLVFQAVHWRHVALGAGRAFQRAGRIDLEEISPASHSRMLQLDRSIAFQERNRGVVESLLKFGCHLVSTGKGTAWMEVNNPRQPPAAPNPNLRFVA